MASLGNQTDNSATGSILKARPDHRFDALNSADFSLRPRLATHDVFSLTSEKPETNYQSAVFEKDVKPDLFWQSAGYEFKSVIPKSTPSSEKVRALIDSILDDVTSNRESAALRGPSTIQLASLDLTTLPAASAPSAVSSVFSDPVFSLGSLESWPTASDLTFRNVDFSSDFLVTPVTEILSEEPTKLEVANLVTKNRLAQVQQPSLIDLTPQLYRKIDLVNRNINASIIPATDSQIYGKNELWTLPLTFGTTRQGDCEDYALEKRQALLNAGIPASALFFAVGHSKATGRHAVLMISTKQGDYILDNMTSEIKPWSEAAYTWTSRQSDVNPRLWSAVSG
jgi:predicted transglutaminase-like cysteine proteinase